MKKTLCFFLLAALVLLSAVLLSSCSGGGEEEENAAGTVTLYVYNWGEYISDGSEDSLNSNKAFEQYFNENLSSKYGCKVKVNYSTYSSNEDMYAKISSGAVKYDVIVPSDYMIERMINEGLLRELDFGRIANYETNIIERFKNPDYDPENKYSVPYSYGMVGIIYNTSIVDEDDENVGSWKLMFDEDTPYRGDILQFNNPRDAFGTAQYYLGYDVNGTDPDEWRAALELLKAQKDIVKGYVMDEIYNMMESGSAAVAAYYAGDFLTMYEENEDLEFYYPKEGTNFYVDAFCVPYNSQNPEIAEEYINFMLSEEPAVANAEATYYASPNSTVIESDEYKEYMNSIKDDAFEILYGSEDVTTSTYKNLSADGLSQMNDLWEELKVESSIGVGIYIFCGVIIAVIVGFTVFFLVRKRIRRI